MNKISSEHNTNTNFVSTSIQNKNDRYSFAAALKKNVSSVALKIAKGIAVILAIGGPIGVCACLLGAIHLSPAACLVGCGLVGLSVISTTFLAINRLNNRPIIPAC